MSRKFWAAAAAAAFLMVAIMTGNAFAQGGGGGGGTGGGTGGTGGFGSTGSTGGFGTTSTSGFGQTQTGLAAGVGGFGGANANQLNNQQNQNIATQLNQSQNRIQQITTQNQITNQVPLHVQFATSTPRPGVLSAAPVVGAKLTRILATRGIGTATAMWEGDTLVLTGTVSNEAVRRQIEGIALLEPGVRNVRNETEVGPIPAVIGP